MDSVAKEAHHGVKAQKQLHRLARKRLECFVTLVPKFLVNDDPEVIHDLRVASRRLQQTVRALDLPQKNNKSRKVLKFLRRIRRAMGPCRNLDVNAGMIQDRLDQTKLEVLKKGWKGLQKHLHENRPAVLSNGRRRVANYDLVSFIARAGNFLAAAIPQDPLPQLRKAVQESLTEWDKACARAEKSGSVEHLHALRIATKALRYRAELLDKLGFGAFKATAKDMKQLQSALGQWHDQWVFLESAAACASRSEYRENNPEVAAALLARIDKERKQRDQDVEEMIGLALNVRRPWKATKKRRPRAGNRQHGKL